MSGPVVFITGASRGIGAATAVAFAQAGWRIAISARTEIAGQALSHQLRRPDGSLLAGSLANTAAGVRAVGAEVLALPMDLMTSASLDAAADGVLAHYGRVDLLINNAVYQDRESNALLAELDDEALLAQQGAQIINVCSGAGKSDPPLRADQGGWGFAYGASKAALARLAGVINREHGPQGLRAFSVNPGLVSTESVTATLGDDGALAQRYGAMPPRAIAAALVWLATDPRGAALARQPHMIDLQPLVTEHGLDR